MRNLKAQGIIEFIIIFSAVLFFFALIMIIVQEQTREKNLERQDMLANDIALSIQDEIMLAQSSSDGYYREFSIPETIIGKAYEINITGNRVYLSAEKIGISYQVSEVIGDVKIGVNKIQKQNGTVYLN